jgi:hypothetical protein
MDNISKISEENTDLSAEAQQKSENQLKEIQEIDQQSEGLVKIINDLKELIENIKAGNNN